MDQEVKEKYVEAGRVVQKARKKAREISEPGKNLEEIAEEIESLIRDEGLQPAFPVNLSVNDEAAHYSPSPDENRELESSDVLKIDIGAQKDGYIADTALTVNPSGGYQELIDASEDVLEKALGFIEPGVTIGELGTFIQNQVPEEYNVVRNLTGHYLDKYEQHAGVSIPNISTANTNVIEEGDAIAVEPFITTGSGKIKNGKKGNIYLHQGGNVRGRTERKLLKEIKNFKGLPFSSRWLDLDARKTMALKKLVNSGVVKHYPVLKEINEGMVAQSEHTILVGAGKNGENIVTTRS